jgi:hypothetical protein
LYKKVTRREVLELAGAAAAVSVGCGPARGQRQGGAHPKILYVLYVMVDDQPRHTASA